MSRFVHVPFRRNALPSTANLPNYSAQCSTPVPNTLLRTIYHVLMSCMRARKGETAGQGCEGEDRLSHEGKQIPRAHELSTYTTLYSHVCLRLRGVCAKLPFIDQDVTQRDQRVNEITLSI